MGTKRPHAWKGMLLVVMAKGMHSIWGWKPGEVELILVAGRGRRKLLVSKNRAGMGELMENCKQGP